jgi:hypothetical protein
MSGSMEEARRIREAYWRLFKTPNGKIVLEDMKRKWLEGKICLGGEDTIRRGAEHDLIQTIINFAQPLPETPNE